jgi:hypothetical protein
MASLAFASALSVKPLAFALQPTGWALNAYQNAQQPRPLIQTRLTMSR